MKTIGLIGGMSWESTALYYQAINRAVAQRRGGLHSAPLVLHSLDFETVVALQQQGDWAALAAMLVDSGRRLKRAGAQLLVVCTNTMHRVAPEIEAGTGLPLLHIADAAAAALRGGGHSRVALLGTRYTMEQPFYRERLAQHGIDCLVPDAAARERVHAIIFEELCKGHVVPQSQQDLKDIVADLQRQGAQAGLLGCTELCLSLNGDDAALPLYDTTLLHALAAVDAALDEAASTPAGIVATSRGLWGHGTPEDPSALI